MNPYKITMCGFYLLVFVKINRVTFDRARPDFINLSQACPGFIYLFN